MKHTPGPWTTNGYCVWSKHNNGNRIIAICPIDKGEGAYKVSDEETLIGNRNLIAAAPDMYEALKWVVYLDEQGLIGGNLATNNALKYMKDALDKAEGK